MAQKSQSVAHYGNDLYREVISPVTNKPIKITYWDFWIVLVLIRDFAGNWDSLIAHLKEKRCQASFLADFEGILNHIRCLHSKFDDTGIKLDDVLAEPASLSRYIYKARRKILDASFMSSEKSEPMIQTPRKICEERAMRGHWDKFPVNPQEYAGILEMRFKTSGFYSEHQSFGLESKLSAFIEKYEQKVPLANLFALYRSFLTVVLEKNNMVDDSFGVIGCLYEGIFKKYFRLDRSNFAMPSQAFFVDLLELLIWEDCGFTYEQHPAFFASLTNTEVSLAESILQQEWQELTQLDIEYQAEEALTMLGILYVQHRQFDKFIPCAKLMGTRHWKRITTMSEMAEKHLKYDLALAVYENCLGPGMHEEFLRDKYNSLKRRIPLRKKACVKPNSKSVDAEERISTTEEFHCKPKYTEKQGQYLTFINSYTQIHGQAPSEAEIQQYFKTTPPSVHQMVLKLEKRGFISRAPRQPRSIKILLSREELPDLE